MSRHEHECCQNIAVGTRHAGDSTYGPLSDHPGRAVVFHKFRGVFLLRSGAARARDDAGVDRIRFDVSAWSPGRPIETALLIRAHRTQLRPHSCWKTPQRRSVVCVCRPDLAPPGAKFPLLDPTAGLKTLIFHPRGALADRLHL